MTLAEYVAAHGVPLDFSAGDEVFRQGDSDRHLYWVTSGLLKATYVSESGKETIKSFIGAGGAIGSLSSMHRMEPCTFGLTCMEPCTLLRLDFASLRQASHDDLEIAAGVIDFLLEFASKKERRERAFLTESAEERYELLRRESPDVVDRLKQQDIARYLGITPVALSRIKGRSGKWDRSVANE